MRLFAVGAVLGPAMAQGLVEQGMTTARAEVVWRLHHIGPMNQRRLSQALRCTPRNVTGLVDALEETGFVERRPHPNDRRATLVTLTKEGEDAAQKWTEESQKLAARLLADFDPNQLTQLTATLDLVLERLGVPDPTPGG
jgi:DNA-binding MarR family transcriptional regulator